MPAAEPWYEKCTAGNLAGIPDASAAVSRAAPAGVPDGTAAAELGVAAGWRAADVTAGAPAGVPAPLNGSSCRRRPAGRQVLTEGPAMFAAESYAGCLVPNS